MPHLEALVGYSGLVLLFLILHLVIGAALLRAPAGKPFFRTIMGSAGREIDRRLNRAGRTPSDLFMRGVVASLIVGASALVIGFAVERLAVHAYGWVAALFFLAINISVMGPLRMMRQASSFKAVQPFAIDTLEKADQYTIARRALEAGAVGLNDYFVAPVFWFLLLQAPGLAVYVALTALNDAFGQEDVRHIYFGGFVRNAEKILNYIPARLTTAYIVIGSLFVSKSNPLRGCATALSQARGFRPFNKGLLVAATAGGLGVTLGGPIKHNEEYTAAHAWVGPKSSSAKITPEDLKRGSMLHFIVFLCVFCTLCLVVAVQFKFS